MTESAISAPCLLLVRHGEIQANVDRIWHGSTDSPLTARGEQQAERVAAFLREAHPAAGALYTSPLLRARQTGAPIARALGLPACVEADLAEYAIGELEGTSYDELLERHRFFARISRDPDFAPPGGESPRGVAFRVLAALRGLLRADVSGPIVVVGHGAAFGLALALLLDANPLAWTRYQKRNCAVSALQLGAAPQLLGFDRVDHLSGV